jgi:hypothetical protein
MLFNWDQTCIHEVGHFLGLRHIWGDGQTEDVGCDVDDFVEDTPNAAFRSSTCSLLESCSSVDLNEDYMDYGSDQCKNVFTNGQIVRMQTVLSNSPRRATLVSSPVLQGQPVPEGVKPDNDLCSQAIPISCGQTKTGSTTGSTVTGTFTGIDGDYAPVNRPPRVFGSDWKGVVKK